MHAMTNMERSAATLMAPADRTPAALATGRGLSRSRGIVVASWIATALLCLQMGFTAYAGLSLPQVAAAFAHLGFPAWFRVELSWAKLIGVALLLLPVPGRLKEWAYAGFAIDLGSAVIAHLVAGDGPEAWGWAAATGALWGLSYLLWRRAQPAGVPAAEPPAR